MFLDLIQPYGNAEEALTVGQVEDDNDSVGTLVISISDRSIAFLSSCIPNLQLDRALVNLKCAEPEVDTNSANVVLLEAIILKHLIAKLIPRTLYLMLNFKLTANLMSRHDLPT